MASSNLKVRGAEERSSCPGRLMHPVVRSRRHEPGGLMIPLLRIAASTLLGIAGFAGLLHLIPRLGAAGTRIGAWLCRAPGLDLVVSVFTWVPPTVLGILFGWRGVVGAIIGQVLGMLVWMFAHELANRKYVSGPRIVTFLNRTVGRLNNHVALWVTAFALPVFIVLRVAELCVYPILTPLVGLPRYRHGDWVNVSRQKFHGLIGHDLIWCLYCDWMTGVYALGAELRAKSRGSCSPSALPTGRNATTVNSTSLTFTMDGSRRRERWATSSRLWKRCTVRR